jgi:long-chain acyl-CoA synthetase
MTENQEKSVFSWLNHYPEGVDWHAPLTAKPLYSLLDEAEARWPDAPAIDFLGKHYCYKELASEVRRMASGLEKMGVKRGVKVGLFLPNCPQMVIAYYAILKAGGTVVNFSPLYSAHEVARQIDDSGTEIMITLNLTATYPKVAEALGKTKLRHIIVTTMMEALPLLKRLAFPLLKRAEMVETPRDDKHHYWADLLDSPEQSTPASIHPQEDVAVLQYTGGTTGVPKGVVLTHANLYINASQSSLWFTGVEQGKEKMLGVLPLFHVFAMTTIMNVGIQNGMELILHPRFELKKVLEDISHKKPTLMPGVPTLFNAINHCKTLSQYTLTSLKFCISGGAPLPVEVKTQFEALTGCVVVEGYGLSEASPVVACNPAKGTNKAGSIGLPLPQTVIEVVDMENHQVVLGAGEVGEICVRGPQVMQGYWQQLDETNLVLREGRLHTGDIGYYDAEGYFFIVDRIKDMLISGGFNVYPRQIEEALYQHPSIAECAVIGIKHEARGEVPKAFVVLKENTQATPADFMDFLKDKLPPYTIPREYEFKDALPKTMVGKVDKKQLKQNHV